MTLRQFALATTFLASTVAAALALNNGALTINIPTNTLPEPSASDIVQDTVPPVDERDNEDFVTFRRRSLFDLRDPQAIRQTVEYDPSTNRYVITEKIGDSYYRPPTYMTFEEYVRYTAQKEKEAFLATLIRRSGGNPGEDPLKPYLEKENIKAGLLNRLFGGDEVTIRPQGNLDIRLGFDIQRVDNPILAIQQRTQGGFDFDMNIQMNVTGNIGKRLKLGMNFNTQAQFDVDNQIKLEFNSDDVFSEDAIIKKIEAGNVSLPLRSQLIQGSQALFGVKTQLQFGRLTSTLLFSQQQSRRNEITVQNGAQQQKFQVDCDKYDENRHYFLSHFNRGSYEQSLTNLPQINSLFSVTRLEVWITNDRNQTDGGVRDVVALADLGETTAEFIRNDAAVRPNPVIPKDLRGQPMPDNYSNNLYDDIISNRNARKLDRVSDVLNNQLNLSQPGDYIPQRMRKLAPSEYSFHPQLGFISLNVNVQPDHVIGVSFQYTYNGKQYQVGEFSQDLPTSADTLNVMFTKMLKTVQPRIHDPMWDLMMKNVYSLGAYQINPEEFRFDVYYQDPGGGEKRFLPSGLMANEPLLRTFSLDRLNRLNDPQPDGQFDFIPGLTILPANGRVIFPVLEPFGSSLQKKFAAAPGSTTALVAVDSAKYCYFPLYDSTVTAAREWPELNRFVMRGTYKSTVSSEISLGAFNIPRGSVQVRAGGQQLREGIDFTVDYNIGRVKILNDGIMASGVPVNVSFEDNALFGFQTRTMMGARFDFFVNDKINIGGTYMRLSERPFTQKVNLGEDPIDNNVFGLDAQYSRDAPWLTKLVDKLPFYSTKAPSKVTFSGEVAYLLPGHNNAIQFPGSADQGGSVYIDDFEGSAARFPLGIPAINWQLASTPQDDGLSPLFPEARLVNNLDYGKNRARFSWYNLDPIFNFQPPAGINASDRTSTYVRQIDQREVFPNLQIQPNQQPILRTFDIAFNPRERGPYNFDALPTAFSRGMDFSTGGLNAPQTRWGGIMRQLETNDFEAANMEFMEFWLMSPFKEEPGRNPLGGQGGDMYIELGNISEDILADNRRFFENGLPGPGNSNRTDSTSWSRMPRVQTITTAFDNDPATRALQDVGFDGFNDEAERIKFKREYLDIVQANAVSPNVFAQVNGDPCADNFKFFRDDDWQSTPGGLQYGNDVIKRYDRYNNPEGNSPASNQQAGFVAASSNNPDTEDLNRDNSLNTTEAYFQYKIPMRKDGEGINVSLAQFITSTVTGSYTYDNNGSQSTEQVTWYQFKVPLDKFTKSVGGIADFRSIRFMRMYLHGWDDAVIMRFAKFELVRNQWRRYRLNLAEGPVIPGDSDPTSFSMQAVNIEENSQRRPVAYVLPPGIQRENSVGPFPNTLQNEQALSVNLCNLQPNDARGIYKNLNIDLRVYKRLKMFIHAEQVESANEGPITRGDWRVFVRLGSDMKNNYYEYEVPVSMSQLNQTPAWYASNREAVWPVENNIDFPLELLKTIKKQRDAARIPLSQKYEIQDGANTVRIVGNPDLGILETVMVGFKNATDLTSNSRPLCAQFWINELRCTGFDENNGLAAQGRVDFQLADLGNITASGTYKSIGWGGLEQRVQQRARESNLQYDISTTLQLDKFLPKKWGLRLPLYFQLSNTIITPQYDPYQTDILLQDKLAIARNSAERDSVEQQAVSTTSIKTLNFTNVRKERAQGSQRKPMPWDIENWSATYGFTENSKRTPLIQSEVMTVHRGNLDYQYSTQPLYWQPFKGIKSTNKWYGLIKEFNINLLPNQIGFRNEVTRRFGETTYRFSGSDATWFEKQFLWDRAYTLSWDFTKSIKFNFTANNNGVIDEPNGRIDTEEKKTQLWENAKRFGRTKNYTHNATLSYQLPFKYIPALDWITSRAQYTTSFGWTAASLNMDSLGNVMQNSRNQQIDMDFNLLNLYNKIPYLKKLNNPPPPSSAKPKKDKDAPKPKDDGKAPSDGKKDDKGKKEKKPHEPGMVERIVFRPLMMVRRFRVNYTDNSTSIIPGFTPKTKFLGQSDETFSAPGLDFAFGMQPNNQWLDKAASNGWITKSIFLSQMVSHTNSQVLDIKATLEPFKDFRIDVDITRNVTRNTTQYFKIDNFGSDTFRHLNPMEMGTFTMSYMPIGTAFEPGDTSSMRRLFKQFEDNRVIISQRLGTDSHSNATDAAQGYTFGYGRYQNDVLVPAFLSAYSGEDPRTTFIGDFRKLMPLPNWRLSYNGLSRMKWFKNFLTSCNLTHAYKSTLSVSSFTTDVNFRDKPTDVNIQTQSFYSKYNIPNIVINEQFSPLIGVDLKFKNELSVRFEYKKSRTLTMGFLDYQMTEQRMEEITAGIGYRAKNINLIDYFSGKKKLFKRTKKRKKKIGPDGKEVDEPEDPGDKQDLKVGAINIGFGTIKPIHDINFKFDFSLRDDRTMNHVLDQNITVATRGSKTIRISPSVDYIINSRLTLRLFYDYNATIPAISNSFPITNQQGGITVRFSLSQ